MIKEQISEHLLKAIRKLISENKLSHDAALLFDAVSIHRTKERSFGDYACNVSMVLARSQKIAPRDLADMIRRELLAHDDFFCQIEVAGPGFLNLTLSADALSQIIPAIAQRGETHGSKKTDSSSKTALIEFVSANPTGGLHLGHARGAFVGDAIARLLGAAGYLVVKEFYVNDAGNQINTLARTIHKRYLELFGEKVTIEDGEYPGEYVIDIARALKEIHGDIWLSKNEGEWLSPIAKFGVEYNLALIKMSLESVDIGIDNWFFESTLHRDGKLSKLIEAFIARNMVYKATRADGADDKVRRKESKAAKFAHMQGGGLFLKTSQFGDDEDRIIQRKDGRFVYLTADLAYHDEKFARGFDLMVDVFGGDHAGHIGRIQAGMQALGHSVEKLKFVVVQMVRLLRGGSEVRFSKRAGEVISLDSLVDEVGKDAARFAFLMRSANAHFDLDLDIIKLHTNENPVFYVQYGHARMATILKKAALEQSLSVDAKQFHKTHQEYLKLPEERELLLRIGEFDEAVSEAAFALEPHRLIHYCQDLIKIFHSYFTKYRHSEKIISDDRDKTLARLALISSLKQTIYNALKLLGISAPERMEMTISDDDG